MKQNLVGYAKLISDATNIVDAPQLAMIEEYMRNCYFNSTLDWIDARTFRKAARESAEELAMLNWKFI